MLIEFAQLLFFALYKFDFVDELAKTVLPSSGTFESGSTVQNTSSNNLTSASGPTATVHHNSNIIFVLEGEI